MVAVGNYGLRRQMCIAIIAETGFLKCVAFMILEKESIWKRPRILSSKRSTKSTNNRLQRQYAHNIPAAVVQCCGTRVQASDAWAQCYRRKLQRLSLLVAGRTFTLTHRHGQPNTFTYKIPEVVKATHTLRGPSQLCSASSFQPPQYLQPSEAIHFRTSCKRNQLIYL